MKENVFDALMYMVEYADGQVRFIDNRDEYSEILDQEGFSEMEVDRAFHWLEGLQSFVNSFQKLQESSKSAYRHFMPEEEDVFDIESRELLFSLESQGIIDELMREIIIDRAVALGEVRKIDSIRLKWLMLIVLYNLPGKEAELAWVERWENNANLH
ncbi:MAG: DUF494 family protein [Pseudomonadota bacterium]